MAHVRGQPARIEDCRVYELNTPTKVKYTLQGRSRAGERTGFFLEPHKILFDAGMSTYATPKAVLMTHTHTDHSWSFVNILSTRTPSLPGQEKLTGRPTYLPESSMDGLELTLRACICLSKGFNQKTALSIPSKDVWRWQNCHGFGVKAGQTFQIPGVKDVDVEVFQGYHQVGRNMKGSVGYGLSEVRHRLKEEYKEEVNIKGRAKELRSSGVKLTEEVKIPMMVFYCDSSIDNLRVEEGWKKYPVVVCECTGYPEHHDAGEMYSRTHTHLDDLLPIIREYSDKHWVLLHASMAVTDKTLATTETSLRKEGLKVTIVRDDEIESHPMP